MKNQLGKRKTCSNKHALNGMPKDPGMPEIFLKNWLNSAKQTLMYSLDFFPLAYYILGTVYAEQLSVGRSIVCFEKAFQLGVKKTVYDCRRLGAGYLITGKNEEAVAVLNEAVQCNEKDVDSRRSLVRAYLNLYKERKQSEFYDLSLMDKAEMNNEILKSSAPRQALGPESFYY